MQQRVGRGGFFLLVTETIRMAIGSKRREALLDVIYAAVGEPARWPEALTRAADDLGALGGMLVYNAPPGEPPIMALGRLSEKHAVEPPALPADMRRPEPSGDRAHR
jgi:hypothetical protein